MPDSKIRIISKPVGNFLLALLIILFGAALFISIDNDNGSDQNKENQNKQEALQEKELTGKTFHVIKNGVYFQENSIIIQCEPLSPKELKFYMISVVTPVIIELSRDYEIAYVTFIINPKNKNTIKFETNEWLVFRDYVQENGHWFGTSTSKTGYCSIYLLAPNETKTSETIN